MASHPMMSNALHARMQRKSLEARGVVCAKTVPQPTIIPPMLTQQAIAAAVGAHNEVPTIRKSHHHPAHTGHHHVHHSGAGNTLVIGGVDTNLLESVQKLFARRILH